MKTFIVKSFRIIGFCEGVSFLLLLLIAMPLKYMFDLPAAVTIVGSLHGGLFVLYILAAAIFVIVTRSSFLAWLGAIVASALPFGPFIYDAKIIKKVAA